MTEINLIPLRWRIASARAARLRRWKLIVPTYASVLVLAAITAHLLFAPEGARAETELARAQEHIQLLNRTIEELNPKLADVQSKLAVAMTIGQQPDWSLLLLVLGRAAGTDIALSSVELAPAPETSVVIAPRTGAKRTNPTSSTRPSDAVRKLNVELAGLGKTQSAVAEFVVRLEQTQLFEQVKLTRTMKEPAGSADAFSFAVSTTLRGGRKTRP
jgi:Tfp pilus assembly protein PilN